MSTFPSSVMISIIWYTLLINQLSNDQVIADISKLIDQQLWVEESINGRALNCPAVKKLAPKAEELIISYRHKDTAGKGKPLH